MAQMGIAFDGPVKVDYSGGAVVKKSFVTEATIDVEAEGIEACRKIVKDHEAKFDKMEQKIKDTPATKKAKAAGGELFVLREKLEKLKGNGDYRAAMTFVRKFDDEQKDAKREEKEKMEELIMTPGSDSKAIVAPVAVASESAPFEVDVEVAAVVQSAVEGSEGAQAQLQAGAGAMIYASEVKAEVASFVAAANAKIDAKLKRVPTRDDALKTVKALLWNPPAIFPSLPTILMLLGEGKLKSQPDGKATQLCTEVATAGLTLKSVLDLALPAVLAHTGSAAGANWQVKLACIGIAKEVIRRLAEPGNCPKQLHLCMPTVLKALNAAAEDKRKEVKAAAAEFLEELASAEASISDEEAAILAERQDRARAEVSLCELVEPLRSYIEAVVVACCIEAPTRSAAEALVEAELRSVVPVSAGSAVAAFKLAPVIERIFSAEA